MIVCLSTDDADGCQVLSMLALDNDTARIPVLTFVTPESAALSAATDPMADTFVCDGPTSLN